MVLVKTVGLLVLSNIFMTIAWYGHLRFKTQNLWFVILISWSIAFFEYCLHVPANRMGHALFSAPQLKLIQEVITFTVFAVFSTSVLKERPTAYDAVAFSLILLALVVSLMQPRSLQ